MRANRKIRWVPIQRLSLPFPSRRRVGNGVKIKGRVGDEVKKDRRWGKRRTRLLHLVSTIERIPECLYLEMRYSLSEVVF
jgi:hypothetical protein